MQEEIIYGMNPVSEALRGSRRAFELFVARGIQDRRLEKLLALATEKGVPIRQRDRHDLGRMCGTDHHQGIALRVEPFPYAELADIVGRWQANGDNGLFLVLDGIQDPHNLGALIRTAACAGFHGVVIPQDRAAGITPAVEKASAGGVETIPVCRVTNTVQALEELKRAGFWIYGTVAEAPVCLFDQDFSGNVALVVGGEGNGIRPLVGKSCDGLVSIPISGGVSSLNASVAGAIAIYEIVRQRWQRNG